MAASRVRQYKVLTKVMPKYRPNLKEGAGKLFRF